MPLILLLHYDMLLAVAFVAFASGDAVASAFYSILQSLDGEPEQGENHHGNELRPVVYIHSVVYTREGGPGPAEDAAAAAAVQAAAAAEVAERQRMLREYEQWQAQHRGLREQEADEGFGSLFSFFGDDNVGDRDTPLLSFFDEW